MDTKNVVHGIIQVVLVHTVKYLELDSYVTEPNFLFCPPTEY